ncbi:MAG: DUF4203 domain-containing protein [Thermomicrobiales bacterium]
MNEVLLGIIMIVLGAGVALFGIWAFGIMLPVWGFIGGFFLGAAAISSLLGHGFLQTTLGVIVGLVIGVLFALLSYFFWYFGVIFAAASVGALIGTGLMRAVGLNAGWFLWLIAIVFGVVFAIGALIINLPPYLVIVNTSLAGAASVVTGLLLLLGRITVDSLGNGPAWATVNYQWFWAAVWFVLGILAMFFQLQKIDEFAEALPEEKWVSVNA